jgi:type VI protein secretion system component VasF
MMELGRFQSIRILLLLCLALGLGAVGQAQSEGSNSTKQGAGTGDQKGASTGTQTQQKSAPLTPAEQKRADLLADTEKLYQLTQELKAEVAKSNKDTLSISVVKKAQEVERLAKSIKERSKNQ